MTDRPFDWTDLLGQHRSIAIHVPILQWTGDYHATALFEELVWRWNKNGRQPFTVTDADLMEKLLLTVRTLRHARARLLEIKGIETDRHGMPRTLYYTVHLDRALESLSSTLMTKRPQRRARNVPNVGDETSSTSIPESVSESFQSNGIAPNDGAAPTDPTPAPTAPADAWAPIKAAISTMFGGLPVTSKGGALKSSVGQTLGILGRAAGDDPDRALAILAKFAGSKDREYCKMPTLHEAVGSWLGKHPDIGAPTAGQPTGGAPIPPGPGNPAVLNGYARYSFRTEGGRLAMKSVAALRAEELAPETAEQFDRDTWTPEMLAAEAAIAEVTS